MRCRPELAPGNAGIDAGARLAKAAASLIEDGVENGAGLEELARRDGVTDRHLRRVFFAAFGVSPVEFVQTQRLLLAKRLLTDTAMSPTDVGIGDWTAQYIAMRALAWPDAFPSTDYGVMKALKEKNLRKVLERADAWRPWRAYAVMHLWRSLEGI